MMRLTAWSRHAPAWARNIGREIAAFGVVGALAFVVETASFNLLIFGSPASGGGVLGSAPVVASVVATLLAMVVSWVGNRYWTYRDRRGAVDRRELTLFVGVNLVGMAVTALPVYVSRELLGLGSPFSDNAARLVGWAAATLFRFVSYRSLVFTRPGEDPTHVPGSIERWTASLRAARRRGALWPWALATFAAVCAYAVSVVFHPGYFSSDSLVQLREALGETPMHDWHPPVMALLWKVLIDSTGAVSAMAALQAAVLWASLWLLAVLVWKRSGSRGLSLAMLAVGLAPHVVTFTGVVWKDVHMAYVLLAACAVALLARELPSGRARTRWALLLVGVLFLAYAVLVRKNAFPAVIPVFVLLVLALWPAPGRRRWLVATGVLVAVTAGANTAVNAVADPLPSRQYAQIPLDDLVHVLTPAQVRTAADRAGADPAFRDGLATAAATCQSKKIPSDAYFHCYRRDIAPDPLSPRNVDAMVEMWTQQMPQHWKGYAEYRLQLFAKLLFQSNYPFQDGTRARPADQPDAIVDTPSNEMLRTTLRSYVLGFVRDLPFLFQGWFWLALSLVLALRRRWTGPYTRELRLLGASSVLYVLAYLPTSPESNYRYVYWPAIAGTVAVLLIVSAHVAGRRAKAAESTAIATVGGSSTIETADESAAIPTVGGGSTTSAADAGQAPDARPSEPLSGQPV
ncbi:GtrA family protein [Streptomyces sp. NPDC093089]|uniref:GtrA family protein n=1 Tax=Streptomyces sp. NPDC093089 TaxID=3366024 RepID=UPI00381C2D4E